MRRTSAWMLAAAVGLFGCGPRVIVDEESDDSSTSSVSAGTTATDASVSTTISSEVSTAPPDGSEGVEPSSSSTTEFDDGCAFLCGPDVGTNFECDEWAQDCPLGQKCMPWANDGGSSWNATRCSPIARDPAQPGEPCTVEGSGVSGIDDCALASMCWGVDPETNTGICYDFCRGSEANPVCLDPASQCALSGEGVLILCFPTCDPLAQDCGEGFACYPINDFFSCVPDASGDAGAFGEGCEFINVCDPGLYCADPTDVPGCAGSIGCCNAFCDLAVDDPDALCPAVADGQVCVPWYELGQAPPGLTEVGHCAVPP